MCVHNSTKIVLLVLVESEREIWVSEIDCKPASYLLTRAFMGKLSEKSPSYHHPPSLAKGGDDPHFPTLLSPSPFVATQYSLGASKEEKSGKPKKGG